MQEESSKSTGRTSSDTTTSRPSTDSTPTSSAADSHAKTSARQEQAVESTPSGLVFGGKCLGSFAQYDRDGSSWKTSQLSLFGGLTLFSDRWPKAGSIVNGKAYPRPMSERPTCGNVSGLLATPVAGLEKGGLPDGTKGRRDLRRDLMPTPSTKPESRRHGYMLTGNSGTTLLDALLQTSNDASARGADGRAPHPNFVEWMMGYPEGWTDLEGSETPSSHKSPSGSDDE